MPSPAPGDFPLLSYLDELVETLRTHVPKALKQWDSEAIHQARVTTRRLKAALDLLEPVLSKPAKKALVPVLKRLRRRLGPLRDIDVMMAHLQDLAGDPKHAAAATWASDAFAQDRDAAREKSREQASAAKVLSRLGRWWGVREEIAEARPAVDALLGESLHLQIDAFSEQAEQVLTHQQAAAVAPEAQAPEQAGAGRVDPHELRISGKALRYTLEMAVKEGHALPKDVARTFKRMQECLGLWHDFVVLSDRVLVASVNAQLGHHDPAAQEKVLELAKISLRKATRELERFCKLWAQRGDELARVIRDSFPLTRAADPVPPENVPPETAPPEAIPAAGDEAGAATQSETDRDPTGLSESSDPEPSPPANASVA